MHEQEEFRIKRKEYKYPIFKKSILCFFFIIAVSVYLYQRAGKGKNEFKHTRGKVHFLEKTYGELPSRDYGKYMYLQIDSSPKPFELFVGKDAGDFKPELERLDSIRPGDMLDVYYDEDFFTEKDNVNRLVYFIDQADIVMFIKGSWEKTMAYFLFGLGTVLFTVVLYLKRTGWIA